MTWAAALTLEVAQAWGALFVLVLGAVVAATLQLRGIAKSVDGHATAQAERITDLQEQLAAAMAVVADRRAGDSPSPPE